MLGEQTSLDLLAISAEILVIGFLLYYGLYASQTLPYSNTNYYYSNKRRHYSKPRHHFRYNLIPLEHLGRNEI